MVFQFPFLFDAKQADYHNEIKRSACLSAGPMCIAFVFYLLFYFLLAPLPLKRLPKRLRLNHQTPCFSCEILVYLVCINWTKFIVGVSRTSFLDGELGSSVMGFRNV